MKKAFWIFISVCTFGFIVVTWDYYLSKYLFSRYCNDGRVGLFVYEKVELDDKYFMTVPEGMDRRLIDSRFVLDDGSVIDRSAFDQDYDFKPNMIDRLNRVGPISARESSVVRKWDNKVLGKAVSLINGLGWWIDSSSFSNEFDTCPDGRDINGYWHFNKSHDVLVGDLFSRKHKQGAD